MAVMHGEHNQPRSGKRAACSTGVEVWQREQSTGASVERSAVRTGTDPGPAFEPGSRMTSLSSTSTQIPTHSLQIWTAGPATSFLTSRCDLLQKEQRNGLLCDWSFEVDMTTRCLTVGGSAATAAKPTASAAAAG